MRGEWYMGAVELRGRRRVLSLGGGSNIMLAPTQPVPLLAQIKQLSRSKTFRPTHGEKVNELCSKIAVDFDGASFGVAARVRGLQVHGYVADYGRSVDGNGELCGEIQQRFASGDAADYDDTLH